ncbi:uncharacterized protein BCR38DRAFT_406143 [Pseudomassariella vexata]|uniref:FAD-binding domain-containing protein n=1 Tax=Pseudomassariella vexata TaxID=1141098 RepID=A0A1Y2E9E3_9PEZI|nr:uncharacterized protein BCR38DRAFT_406143 [Pseudomassariella vexata]ORY68190.1 hypothetical protein BCR38DRAFT_406143 [Pseudomassariella vexata]
MTQSHQAAAVPFEEGVLSTPWNNGGRDVLLGDSVHKATVNPGLGPNLAADNICHLVNEVIALIRQGGKPTKAPLGHVYEVYEKKQACYVDRCSFGVYRPV